VTVRDSNKPHVWQHRTLRHWLVYFQGDINQFETFAEAYDFGYTIARVRNVVVDAFRGLP